MLIDVWDYFTIELYFTFPPGAAGFFERRIVITLFSGRGHRYLGNSAKPAGQGWWVAKSYSYLSFAHQPTRIHQF